MKFTTAQSIEQYMLKQDRERTNHYTLDRMEQAVERLHHPELQYRVIHVGGTAGKGSTCQMITTILTAAHRTVGTFTSPAISSSLERIQINATPITQKKFVALVNSIWSTIEDLELTYFEFFVICALQYFADNDVTDAVIEVGMGGRLDATNVVTPTIAIVTNVGLDHTKYLGNTKSKIAKEKQAIIKPGAIGLTSSKHVTNGHRIDVDTYTIHNQSLRGIEFSYYGMQHVQLNVLGEYQVRNAILSIEATRALHIPESVIREGLQHTQHSARFEIVQQDPLVIIDGAHNPDKMRAFISSLKKVVNIKKYDSVVALISLKQGKDPQRTLRPLLAITDTVIITTFGKSMTLKVLKAVCKELNPKVKIITKKDSEVAHEAFQKSLKKSPNSNSLGIITGSLYLIGDLRQHQRI